MFLLTVVFGLWHGPFVMPVLLSLIGPLNGGGHAAAAADPAAAETAISPPPPPSGEATKTISTLGGTLTAPPSLTFKNSFVFGKLTGS